MQNTSILDVNSIAYTYRIDVTAQYGAKPYTAIISYFYISYNSCVVCEEAVFSDFGSKAAYRFYLSHKVFVPNKIFNLMLPYVV